MQETFDWGQVDMGALAKCLLALCRQVKELLKDEARLLKVKSPTYILGIATKYDVYVHPIRLPHSGRPEQFDSGRLVHVHCIQFLDHTCSLHTRLQFLCNEPNSKGLDPLEMYVTSAVDLIHVQCNSMETLASGMNFTNLPRCTSKFFYRERSSNFCY